MSYIVSPKTFTEQGIKPEAAKRLSLVWHLRKTEGMTFGEIGEVVGTCRQAAQIRFRNAERLISSATSENQPPLYGLSVRASHILSCQNQGIMDGIEISKDAIRTAVLSGRLCLGRLRNCGKKTTKEILKWLNLTSN